MANGQLRASHSLRRRLHLEERQRVEEGEHAPPLSSAGRRFPEPRLEAAIQQLQSQHSKREEREVGVQIRNAELVQIQLGLAAVQSRWIAAQLRLRRERRQVLASGEAPRLGAERRRASGQTCERNLSHEVVGDQG